MLDVREYPCCSVDAIQNLELGVCGVSVSNPRIQIKSRLRVVNLLIATVAPNSTGSLRVITLHGDLLQVAGYGGPYCRIVSA